MSEFNLITLLIDHFDLSVAVIAILNLIALLIRLILESKGYPVSQTRNFNKDLKNMFSLAKETNDSGTKLIYFILPSILSIFQVWFFISAFFFFMHQCSI
ncbi:hypothetical protein DLM78_21410 [Leptospira stimsonii]|uniref:Uncharacterized protein n=1 Tax=Leptospira stimsonii TaxID=2202203 RepID=A0A8B3CN98_9LEPT|nr:hypothetical protein DLM78_21410 [Leptospira stimsonii]